MEKEKENKETGSRKFKKMALGRGLDSLIPGIESIDNRPSEYFMCDVELIRSNRYQPRLQFSEEKLQRLTDSVKQQGILQPLVVRKNSEGYELVAGERRLKAARRSGLKQVPVIIRDISDSQLLEISIIENIQRENLNPMEEADAYRRLMDMFHLTQDQVAQRVGKSRSAVANFIRLLNLPDEIKDSIMDNVISMGHARALLGLASASQQRAVWRQIISKGLSVRQTEEIIKKQRKESEKSTPKPPEPSSDDIYFSSLAEDLSRSYGTRVQINRRGKKGRVVIEFYNDNDLDRLL
jgi:ParB family chromosome partitioning protein